MPSRCKHSTSFLAPKHKNNHILAPKYEKLISNKKS
jgi:hypothetical protein